MKNTTFFAYIDGVRTELAPKTSIENVHADGMPVDEKLAQLVEVVGNMQETLEAVGDIATTEEIVLAVLDALPAAEGVSY